MSVFQDFMNKMDEEELSAKGHLIAVYLYAHPVIVITIIIMITNNETPKFERIAAVQLRP